MPGTYLDPRVQKKKKKPEQFGPLYPGQNAGQGKSLPEIPKPVGQDAGKNIGLKDIPLQTPAKPKASTSAFPDRPRMPSPNNTGAKPKARPNVPRTYAKPNTPDPKPMGMSFKGTQVQTQKGPASGKMSYEAPKDSATKQRGTVKSSVPQNVMDVRMNNQRTVRGKLRDSKGGRG